MAGGITRRSLAALALLEQDVEPRRGVGEVFESKVRHGNREAAITAARARRRGGHDAAAAGEAPAGGRQGDHDDDALIARGKRTPFDHGARGAEVDRGALVPFALAGHPVSHPKTDRVSPLAFRGVHVFRQGNSGAFHKTAETSGFASGGRARHRATLTSLSTSRQNLDCVPSRTPKPGSAISVVTFG